jgi:hypothetical protein
MSRFFDPSPKDRRVLERLADEIPGIQETLVENHKQLRLPDRVAHQQQIAGGKVFLRIAEHLPQELEGVGLFQPPANRPPGGSRVEYTGIGRVSTGLGCPHIETDPDFLGLMLAFRAPDGRRVDFIAINDPTAPTDHAEDFIALLRATADAAGAEVPFGDLGKLDLGNLLASQSKLLLSLARHAGTHAPRIAAHVVKQTTRTVLSSSAYQTYWTGVVRARNLLGKFAIVPTEDVNAHREFAPRGNHLSMDWKKRQSNGPLDFRLYWIPFRSERETPLEKLSKEWKEEHRTLVGTATFPQNDPETRDAKLLALLASEMGANPGNWIEDDSGQSPDLPATDFTAARFLVYRKSQQGRGALPEGSYSTYFERGEVSRELADELVRRYEHKRAAGHAVPALGDIASGEAV